MLVRGHAWVHSTRHLGLVWEGHRPPLLHQRVAEAAVGACLMDLSCPGKDWEPVLVSRWGLKEVAWAWNALEVEQEAPVVENC